MRRPAIAAGVVLAATSAAWLRAQQPPQAVFRATADLVVVDVAVRSANGALTGLTASDFVLADDGVAQQIELVDAEAMPIDVTLIADVSHGTMSEWTHEVTLEQTLARLRADVQSMAGLLRPDDRLRLLTSDTYVRQVFPMQAPAAVRVESVEGDGLASVFDALVAAMLRPVEPNRRHLIVAWTKTSDTVSAADAAAVQAVARQSDAVLHIVMRDSAPPSPLGESARAWRPFRRFGYSTLTEATSVTGGTFHGIGTFGDRSAADVFKEVFAAFRTGYVLRYSPQGVKREGWHDIAVTIPKVPGAEVRARRGYAVERAVPELPAAKPRPPAAQALDDAVQSFSRQDSDLRIGLRRATDFRGLIRDYRAAGNPWPAAPRQEALFVLELAAAGLVGRDPETRADALTLLAGHHELVRAPLGPDRFECAWRGAAQAVLQGGLLAKVALDTIPASLARCPNDPTLYLARAISSDQFFSTSTGRVGATRDDLAEVGSAEAVRKEYEAAMRFPAVAPEARVRAAWLAYRTRQPAQAVTDLDGIVGPIADPALRYYGELVRGQALRVQGRVDDAIAAFRAALVAWPGAQSARVALMTLLVARGDRAEAEALAEAIQADPGVRADPWWFYWQGEYRNFPGIVGSLKELAR